MEIICAKCGTENTRDSVYCKKCGVRIGVQDKNPSRAAGESVDTTEPKKTDGPLQKSKELYRTSDLPEQSDLSLEISSDAARPEVTATHSTTTIQFDLDSITSASQVLSAETDLEQLLTKMITLVMANSGAERAELMLRQENDWRLLARGDIASEKYDVLLDQPFEPGASNNKDVIVPERVFEFCRRSREVLIVEDAQLDSRFAEDKMIQAHNIKSMACIPILSQGKFKGMLYLENRQMADVFTPKRMEILKHLASQFGISVENALLYNNLNLEMQKLRESERQLSLIYESIGDILFYIGVEPDDCFRFLSVNDAFLKATGLTRDQIVGKRVEEVIPELSVFMVLDNYKKAIKENRIVRWEETSDYPSGKKIGEVSIAPVFNEKGICTHLLGSLHDITDLKVAEKQLEEREQFTQSILMSIHDHIVVLDRHGVILAVNKSWIDFGYENDVSSIDLVGPGQNYLDICLRAVKDSDESARLALEGISSVLNGSHNRFELEYPCHSESEKRWFLMSVMPMLGTEGGVVVSHANISERKQAEARLKESETKFRNLVEQSPLSIMITNQAGKVIQVNSAFVKLWEMTEDTLGEFYEKYNILQDTNAEKAGDMPLIEKAYKDGESVILPSIQYDPLEMMKKSGFDKPSGRKRWIQCRIYPTKDVGGRLSNVVHIIEDITERKQTEESLKESEEKFRNLVDQSPLSIQISNPDGKVIQVNPAYLKLWGIPESILGELYEKYNVLQDQHAKELGVMPLIEKAYKNGEVVNLPSIQYDPREMMKASGFDKPSGRKRWVQTSIYPTKDEGGRLLNVVHIEEDITDRKQAETRLEESETKYRQLVEDISDVIYSVDTKGDVVFVSPAIKSLIGYDPHEVIGKHFSSFVHAEDIEKMKKGLESALAGKIIPTDYRILNKAGSYIWGRALSKVVKDDKNNILGIRGVISDITERKRIEEELRISEQDKSLILNNTAEIIAFHDLDHNIKWANKAYLEATGLSISKTIGQKCFHAWGLDRLCTDCPVLVAMETGEPQEAELTPQNQEHWPPDQGNWAVRATPVKDDGGYVVGAIEVAYDITLRKQAEEKIRHYTEQLKALAVQMTLTEEKERRHIAADLHDHIGHSLALGRMQLDAVLKADSKMERTVLINDVSNILLQAIQDTKDLIFELSSPLMNEIGLASAISEWLEEYMERRYGLETELTDKCEDESLDRDLRAILFRNVRELFTNIIKHARAKKVSVVLESANDMYTIKVKDDGIGFNPEPSPQEAKQERGFGLFSIQERMADLCGSLEVLSQPGKGTQIIMSVPIKNSDSKKQT